MSTAIAGKPLQSIHHTFAVWHVTHETAVIYSWLQAVYIQVADMNRMSLVTIECYFVTTVKLGNNEMIPVFRLYIYVKCRIFEIL